MKPVRRALAGFGFLLLWSALLMAIVRNYSGAGGTAIGWNTFNGACSSCSIFRRYGDFPGLRPAGPAAHDECAGGVLPGADRRRFELFQVVFVYLNLLLFLPAVCCCRRSAESQAARLAVGAAVRLEPAGDAERHLHVDQGGSRVLRGSRPVVLPRRMAQADTVRTTAAFVALAAGLLTHYSAGPYVAILTLHYLIRVFPRRENKWRELAGIASICGCWWASGWPGRWRCMAARHVCVNTSVTDSRNMPAARWERSPPTCTTRLCPRGAEPRLARRV